MKNYELIAILEKLPAGAEIYVNLDYDSGYGHKSVKAFNCLLRTLPGINKDAVYICASED